MVSCLPSPGWCSECEEEDSTPPMRPRCGETAEAHVRVRVRSEWTGAQRLPAGGVCGVPCRHSQGFLGSWAFSGTNSHVHNGDKRLVGGGATSVPRELERRRVTGPLTDVPRVLGTGLSGTASAPRIRRGHERPLSPRGSRWSRLSLLRKVVCNSDCGENTKLHRSPRWEPVLTQSGLVVGEVAFGLVSKNG